jgi:hypothetical protein
MTEAEGNMRRHLLAILIAMLLAWCMSGCGPHHPGYKPQFPPPRPVEPAGHDVHHALPRTKSEFRQAMCETGREVRAALSKLGEDLRDSLHETAEEVREAIKYDSSLIREVEGEISYNEERARDEARAKLNQEVTTWLEASGVPKWWKPAPGLVDALIVQTTVQPVIKDYGTLYQAKLRADFSPGRVVPFVRSYQHQLVHRRIVFLSSGLAFVLCCLAALAGYIRADEATKGYYTNRLRLLATAGVAAAGVALYKFVA